MQPGAPAPEIGKTSLQSMEISIYRHHTTASRAEDEALLSPQERERANRLATAALRERYVSAHAFLRLVLASHTGHDAAALRFGAGDFGKPRLIDFPRLHFNFSHSGDWALAAVADAGPVGVDLEEMRPLSEHGELAARFFSTAENAALAALPHEQRLRAFYEIWTKKEAVVKADGRGLAMPLHSFSVPQAARGATQPDGLWTVCTLDAPDGCVAATAFPARVRAAVLRPQEFRP